MQGTGLTMAQPKFHSIPSYVYVHFVYGRIGKKSGERYFHRPNNFLNNGILLSAEFQSLSIRYTFDQWAQSDETPLANQSGGKAWAGKLPMPSVYIDAATHSHLPIMIDRSGSMLDQMRLSVRTFI
jgi:hypothetical protein